MLSFSLNYWLVKVVLLLVISLIIIPIINITVAMASIVAIVND